MDKTTFIDEIKKCFTLLQENHVIKKAVEDLYNKETITKEDVIELKNKVDNTLVSTEQVNLGNDYYIRSTEEDGLYIYKNEIRLLKLQLEYYEEDEFYYFNLYLGEAPAVINISVSNEDGFNIYYDVNGIQNTISFGDIMTINSGLTVNGTVDFNNELFFNAFPLWFNINGNIFDISKGPNYKSTANRDYIQNGDIVNATLYNTMQITKKFCEYYQDETHYYFLFHDSEHVREQLWIGFSRGEQDDVALRFITISKETREINMVSHQFQV